MLLSCAYFVNHLMIYEFYYQLSCDGMFVYWFGLELWNHHCLIYWCLLNALNFVCCLLYYYVTIMLNICYRGSSNLLNVLNENITFVSTKHLQVVNELSLEWMVQENPGSIHGENNSWPVFTYFAAENSEISRPTSPGNQRVNTKKVNTCKSTSPSLSDFTSFHKSLSLTTLLSITIQSIFLYPDQFSTLTVFNFFTFFLYICFTFNLTTQPMILCIGYIGSGSHK
jgi:hypothetical protein